MRDSGAKRIAGWVSVYRSIRGSPDRAPEPSPGTLPGTPRPGAPPGGGAGNFRARAGAPGGRPGAPREPPAGASQDPPKWPLLGAYIYYICIRNPPSGGRPLGCTFGLPGGGTPGGQKSAHFFGYLITLPVGTVWGHFFGPPFWAILGGYPGTPAEGSVYRTHWTHPVGHSWAGPLGRRASDGYPLGGLSPNGWYVPSGRGPPSRQGRKSAQDREVAGRRRPFARAKRGPTTGVTGKVRKCLAEHIRPCQFQVGPPQCCPSGPQPLGTDGRRPDVGHIAAGD